MAQHVARQIVPALQYRPIADTVPALTAALRDFLVHRSDAEVYAAPLTPELAASLRPWWASRVDFFKALGPPLALALVERDTDGALPSYRWRVRYADRTRLVRVVVAASGLISEIQAVDE